ncbi:MAG: type II toxin-antitoxin system VapC family toxin [Xanthobacteraceae bacterium]|jgi:predicted nucleic acid-binding protein
MTLVDSNVLLDVLSGDPRWLAWSVDALDARAAAGRLLINEVVYAELSVRMNSEAELDKAVIRLNVHFERSPQRALFLAGQSFRRYRTAGGTRTGVLSDLFIGAHAQVLGCPVLTRDVRRYRTYFPDVEIIAPAR